MTALEELDAAIQDLKDAVWAERIGLVQFIFAVWLGIIAGAFACWMSR